MSQLDQLPPDQRAALSLILRQGRSYEDVAALLRIAPEAVRERALAALAALGPRDAGALPPERRAEIGDYLLGQQPASRRGETREYLEESPGGRAWARVVGGELRPLAGDSLPDIPAEGAAPDRGTAFAESGYEPDPEPRYEPEQRPTRALRVTPEPPVSQAPFAEANSEAAAGAQPSRRVRGGGERGRRGLRSGTGRRRSAGGPGDGVLAAPVQRSRVGQAVLLLGLGVIVAALIILILEGAIFGGGSASSSSSDNGTLGSSSVATASNSTGATGATGATGPRIVAQITFTPVSRTTHAAAVANVAQEGKQKAFALVAQGLAPTKHFAYAVWLTNPGGASQPLGFIDQAVGTDGRAAAEGVLPNNAAQFKQIVITEETASKPTHPGTVVLVGQLNP